MSITDHSEPIGFDITLPLVCVSCCVYVRGCHCVYLYKHMNKNIPNKKEILNKDESDIPRLLTSLTHLESSNNTFMSIFTLKLNNMPASHDCTYVQSL